MTMTAKKIIGHRGPGSLTPAVPAQTVLNTANNGGNNPWTVPSAVQRNGVTLFGWVDGSGNVECRTYTDDTATLSAITTIHASFEVDAHSSPAFLRRSSDGKLLCVYSLHNGAVINLRTSTNADDPTAWSSATNLDSQLGATRYTDYQLHQLAEEDNHPIYLFYRDEPSAGTDSRWCLSSSTDGGATWAAQSQIFRIASTRSYVISWSDSASRIHYIATNGASSGFTKLGHFYYQGGNYYKSDGTQIVVSRPYTFTDITTIYTGSGNVFPSNVAIDSAGNPVVCGVDTLNVYYFRWTGSTWRSTLVAAAGTGYSYNNDGNFGTWGQAVDDGNPNVVWLLRDTGGNPGIYRYQTSDGGVTFSNTWKVAGSGSQQQVICVRNPNRLRAFWQVGTWTDYNSWNVGLTGALDAPITTSQPPASSGGGGSSGGGSSPTFLTRPSSAPITISGGSSASVSNVSIVDTSPLYTSIGIYIHDVHGTITIRDVDLADLAGGILLADCSGTLVIDNVRSRNIGDNTIGSGHSNHIQMGRCVFDGYIANCKFLGGHTEDMVSIFQSGGQGTGHELVVHDNQWQGLVTDQATPTIRAWTRDSGTGIIIGDGAGSSNNGYTIVRNNTFLTPGQIGIALIDGPAIHVHDNIIYGQQHIYNNVPIGAAFGNPIGEVDHNSYYWTNMDGSHPGPYNGAGSLNFHDNTADSGLNPANYTITL